MIKISGLKNCDSCKKAVKWTKAEGLPAVFRDIRADPVSMEEVKRWGGAVGFDVLVNKASTTWRGLSDAEKAEALGEGAASLLVEYPTLIKRPIFEVGDVTLVGFKTAQQTALKAL